MGKIAFVFPGQGAQYSGMGRELAECSSGAREVFVQADAVRPGTSRQCFEGSEEELKDTSITQPCLFAVELAAAAALCEAGICPAMTAGFSLGEWSAMVCAGAAPFSEGFSLVCERGRLMQQAALAYPAFMAAVVKLPSERVKEVCASFSQVYPVNFNCPGQVSVAGAVEEKQAFTEAVKVAGGRAIPLKVQSGFHSPFMNEAAAEFAEALEKAEFTKPNLALYSDCLGDVYTEDIPGLLARQISSPVLWEQLVRAMLRDGADTFIELGPGTTLSGMIQRIAPEVRTLHVEDAESLAQTIAALEV